MLIRVDPSSPVPLGDQVAASVRRAVADGRAAAGDRLPPAREVAGALGINLHTVLRGYQQLRDEGLVDLRRGRGAVLTERATGGRAELERKATELAELARRLGLDESDALGAVRAAFR
ncbi:GntR family transcriptional regulator [Pseudonocardia sp. EV170527-09]|uniref:GntR family transcriptional regulator n=1 Tax=unclassified Pseudonocardia TaxID=2619320 RepID=UPI0006CB4DB8|nr:MULTISPECIES: GntR family transcriptional regulator [unclassified Pseudonocardia]ALE83450.1 GntR family transcriptional regulator [Pseudonocardia sp. HH130629-09]KAA1024294.1 GntR family transcriptional regulator [Pseudonocardia sp. EV170527-09]OLM14431.1 Transcriptional regulator, GntR family [Pseudonocardia sp. Ae505_Ps2]OLM31595.1 Transcriptional regulator, GntR family [Pseudonocardia sp. Ae717_Ps2]